VRLNTLKLLQRYLKLTSNLSRKFKVSLQMILDVLVSFGCFLAAFLLGGASLQLISNPVIFLSMITSIVFGMVAFVSFGLYWSLVRFITGKIFVIITKSVLIGSSVFTLFIVTNDINVPLTIPFIYALLLFLSIAGTRFAVRQLFRNSYQTVKKPALIYGAGEAGRELNNLLFYNRRIQSVAFMDDNVAIQGMTIGGCKVYSNGSLAKVLRKYEIELVLLALPTISRQRRREIINIFHGYNLEIKSIPPMSKILTGQTLVSELQPVTPELLLGRDAISPIQDLMCRNILDKSVMVTGAGGSIGAELCRQVLAQSPLKIILFESSELALYQINEELLQLKNQTNSATIIVPVLGSIQDKKCVTDIIRTLGVTNIYHAAAYKHVPLLEDNAIEGIKNNVFGTLTLVQVAIELGVESFTLISTDKAVRPTNIMGASKRIAELICQAHAREKLKIKFSIVRFGNVLGSSGSVIPLFQKQIDAGGPVTITHPEVTRYFMTIPEAAGLVIQASAMASGGDVFVLNMGEPVKIIDLAVEMVKLAGLQSYFVDQTNQEVPKAGHIPICVTGLRPGEKLYEELLIGNTPLPTEHPRIMKASEVSLPMADMTIQLALLRDACATYDLEAVLDVLKELPIEFSHNNHLPPDIVRISSQAEVDL
jgi:FlaA1/EpsC-like NDP-sugar epimerase